jgi:regulator of sirC expression with transglutaminase-like and TPR domain
VPGSFAEIAAAPLPPLDALALALAAEFRQVDTEAALGALDALGEEVVAELDGRPGTPEEHVRACAAVLAGRHGFTGDREEYDHPDNSMLDVVLDRRRGLPILLSVVWVETARRAGVPLAGVGLGGHFVVAHFGAGPRPLLLDPFDDGARVDAAVDEAFLEPWTPPAIAMRMLNNLVLAFRRRGDTAAAIHAAGMRLALPADDAVREGLQRELQAMRARLN